VTGGVHGLLAYDGPNRGVLHREEVVDWRVRHMEVAVQLVGRAWTAERRQLVDRIASWRPAPHLQSLRPTIHGLREENGVSSGSEHEPRRLYSGRNIELLTRGSLGGLPHKNHPHV
jgi:hypothetical protein